MYTQDLFILPSKIKCRENISTGKVWLQFICMYPGWNRNRLHKRGADKIRKSRWIFRQAVCAELRTASLTELFVSRLACLKLLWACQRELLEALSFRLGIHSGHSASFFPFCVPVSSQGKRLCHHSHVWQQHRHTLRSNYRSRAPLSGPPPFIPVNKNDTAPSHQLIERFVNVSNAAVHFMMSFSGSS